MKRTLASLILLAGLMAFLAGCSSAPVSPPDTVTIVDVQSAKIPDSEYTTYKLKVVYSLRSADHAVVMIGFDLEEPGRFIILGQQEVKKGSGEVEIRADVRLPDRSTVTVHADLSRAHHPLEWTSLANDSRELPISK